MSGLSSTGLTIETIAEIRESLEADLRQTFFASLPLGDKTVLGHLIGLISERLGLIWERLEESNSGHDVDKATGALLAALCLLTGTFKSPATASRATLTLCGTNGTLVGAESLVDSASTGKRFATIEDATLATLTAWAALTAYAVGDRRRNGGTQRCYQCITAGTSAASGGPTTQALDITDGTAHWAWIGDGAAAADVDADCEETGEITALARDLTVIATPIAGLSTVTNLEDADEGSDEETDEILRVKREVELAGSGGTTADALRAQLRDLLGVTSVKVFNNPSDTTDGDGVPPHSFEAMVIGGTVQDIVDTIGKNLPEGIGTYSSTPTSGTFVDSEGVSITIYYTRPTAVNIYAVVRVEVDASKYPADGNTQVRDAILEFGEGYETGSDVDPTALGAQAFSVAGVRGATRVDVYTDVINNSPGSWVALTSYSATPGGRSVVLNDNGRAYICITAGTSAASGGPTGTDTDITDGTAHWRYLGNKVTIASRQLADFDSTRVTVVSTPVTP